MEPEGYFHVHKSPPLVPTLNQMHPVYNFPSYFLKIYFNIVFPSTPRSFFRFPDQFFTYFSSLPWLIFLRSVMRVTEYYTSESYIDMWTS
jgi:hypothetical protein